MSLKIWSDFFAYSQQHRRKARKHWLMSYYILKKDVSPMRHPLILCYESSRCIIAYLRILNHSSSLVASFVALVALVSYYQMSI